MGEKKMKAHFEAEIECPKCEAQLKVAHYKKRTKDPVPGEYEETTHVTLNSGSLGLDVEPPAAGDTTVEGTEKPAPKRSAKAKAKRKPAKK